MLAPVAASVAQSLSRQMRFADMSQATVNAPSKPVARIMGGVTMDWSRKPGQPGSGCWRFTKTPANSMNCILQFHVRNQPVMSRKMPASSGTAGMRGGRRRRSRPKAKTAVLAKRSHAMSSRVHGRVPP